MPTIKFDDFLKEEQLKDPKFREGYYEEQARLENAVAVLKAREAARTNTT